MAILRTPLEQALGERLDLDMDDLLAGDYEAQDEKDAALEAEAMEAALATGEHLYREAVRSGVKGLGGVRLA